MLFPAPLRLCVRNLSASMIGKNNLRYHRRAAGRFSAMVDPLLLIHPTVHAPLHEKINVLEKLKK